MLHTLFRKCLWVVLGLGVPLLLLPSLQAQDRLRGPTYRLAPRERERPAAQGQQEIDAVKQAEEELDAQRAQLRILDARLKAQLEQVRVAEERLQLAKQRLDLVNQRPAAPTSGTGDQRLQQLEQKVDRLQKELAALRQQRSVTGTAEKKFVPIDLEARTNEELTDNFGGRAGNNLRELPTGNQILGGVPFRIRTGIIQLGSKVLDGMPARVENIPVNRCFAKLHLLHATQFGGGPNQPGSEWFVEDGTPIGEYRINFDDGSTLTIPLVYGRDVRDWFYVDGEKEPSQAKVVWKGDNVRAKEVGAHVRLYLSTWENPYPDYVVQSIDFASTMATACAPFCVAITAEGP
jgi:hypothetical protein